MWKIHKIDIEDVDTNSDNDNNVGPPEEGTDTPPSMISPRYKDIDSYDKEDDNNGFEICEVDGRDIITRQNEYYQSNLALLGDERTGDSPRGRGHTRRRARWRRLTPSVLSALQHTTLLLEVLLWHLHDIGNARGPYSLAA